MEGLLVEASRTRYLDLAVNAESRALITARSSVLRERCSQRVRRVETRRSTAAAAAPPPTVRHAHQHTYSMDLFLHGAPELYLKRLCVGGVETGFSSTKVRFRNSGASTSATTRSSLLGPIKHTPTTLSGLTAAANSSRTPAQAANGAPSPPAPDGQGSDAAPPPRTGRHLRDMAVRTVHDAISEALGERIDAIPA